MKTRHFTNIFIRMLQQILPKPREIRTIEDGQRYHNELTTVAEDDTLKSTLLKGALYISGNDNHCCPHCWPLDNTVWGTNPAARPAIPRHNGCRCIYLPKAKTWADFGFKTNFELPPVERAFVLRGRLTNDGAISMKGPRGGDVSKKIISVTKMHGSMEDWIKTLTPQIQRQFFATELAFQLWSTGKIKAFDLIDPSTYELRSDEELSRL